MLDLSGTTPPEILGVAISSQLERIPEANWGLDTKLVLESTQRGRSVQGPVTPGGASESILEEHADDGHHGKTSVGDLSVQPLGLDVAFAHGVGALHSGETSWHAEDASVREVTRGARRIVLVSEELGLAEAAEEEPLRQASSRNLGQSGKAVRHISELDALARRQVATELEVLWRDVANGGEHAHAAMLDLSGTTPPEILGVAISSQLERIPEANWGLDTKLVLESTQRGRSVQGPVTPGGASESILEEHADDGHHGKTTVGDLGSKLLLLLRWVGRSQHLEVEVASSRRGASRLVLGELAERRVGKDLRPAGVWHLGDSGESVWHVSELQSLGRRQVTWELASDLRRDVTHGRKHGDAAVLQLSLTSAGEVLNAAIGSEASRIPEANWSLHTKLVLESRHGHDAAIRPGSLGALGRQGGGGNQGGASSSCRQSHARGRRWVSCGGRLRGASADGSRSTEASRSRRWRGHEGRASQQACARKRSSNRGLWIGSHCVLNNVVQVFTSPGGSK